MEPPTTTDKIRFVNSAIEAMHEDLKVFVRVPYAKFFTIMAFWNGDVISRKQLADLTGMDPETGAFGRLQKFLEDELYLIQVAKKKGPSRKEVEFRITEKGKDRGRTLIGILNYALNFSDAIKRPEYASSRPLLQKVMAIVLEKTKEIADFRGTSLAFERRPRQPRRIVVRKKKGERNND
jgi:hypothetical protein